MKYQGWDPLACNHSIRRWNLADLGRLLANPTQWMRFHLSDRSSLKMIESNKRKTPNALLWFLCACAQAHASACSQTWENLMLRHCKVREFIEDKLENRKTRVVFTWGHPEGTQWSTVPSSPLCNRHQNGVPLRCRNWSKMGSVVSSWAAKNVVFSPKTYSKALTPSVMTLGGN